jgi:hypothetical protein
MWISLLLRNMVLLQYAGRQNSQGKNIYHAYGKIDLAPENFRISGQAVNLNYKRFLSPIYGIEEPFI